MSGWNGPTWSQWYGATQEADQNFLTAEENFAAAQKWKAYAARLEKELDEVWDLYREARGNGSGQRVLKETALEEIQKMDPGNKMLDLAVRKEIFDQAKESDMNSIRKKY